jgi:hypothetical protein
MPRQHCRGIFYSSNIADDAQRHLRLITSASPVFVDLHTSFNTYQSFKINSKGYWFESSRGSQL